MKIKFTPLFIIAAIAASNVQTVSAQSWSLTGNSGTVETTNFLGTKDNKGVVFRTNNIERMRLSNTGKLGIGTTTPVALLELKGKDYNSAFRINYGSGLGAGLYFDGRKDWSLMSTNAGAAIGTGSFGFYNVQTTTYPFYVDSTDNTLLNWNNSQRKYGKVNLYNNAAVNSIGLFAQGRLAGIAGYAGSYDSTQWKELDFEINQTKNHPYTNVFGVYGAVDGSTQFSVNDYYAGVAGIATNKTFGDGVAGQTTSEWGHGVSGLELYVTSAEGTGEARCWGTLGGRDYLNDPQTHTTYLLTTGVYGWVADTIGENRYALYSDGNLALIGNMYTVSDERMKTDIKPMQNAMNIINRLQPKTYQFINPGKGYSLPKEKQYGLLAQDVQKILPELVQQTAIPKSMQMRGPRLNINGKPAKEGKEANLLNYQAFIPLLIKATQELSNENDSLKITNTDLQTQLTNVNTKLDQLMQLMQSHGMDVSSVQQTSIFSAQTTLSVAPNPTNGSAVINYTLPAAVSKAQIIITNISGTTIKTFMINASGKGQVFLNTSNLANGNYNCSLYVNSGLSNSIQIIVNKK